MIGQHWLLSYATTILSVCHCGHCTTYITTKNTVCHIFTTLYNMYSIQYVLAFGASINFATTKSSRCHRQNHQTANAPSFTCTTPLCITVTITNPQLLGVHSSNKQMLPILMVVRAAKMVDGGAVYFAWPWWQRW